MDYAKIVDYAPKDALATGNPAKLIKGTELGAEFDSIAVMSATKGDKSGTLAQFAATTSAQLAGVVSDETGSGALVFSTSPTLATPVLGTPASGTLTNCTGLPASSVVNTPAGSIAATTVQAAIDELDTEKAALAGSASQAFSVAAPTSAAHAVRADTIAGRNIITNGGFTVNQRVYASSATLASGSYGHDRWKAGAGGGDYSFTQLASNTTITIAANKTLIQVIEDKNVAAASYVLSWTGTAQARYAVNSATPAGSYASSPILITGQTPGTVMSIEFGNGASSGTVGVVQLEAGSVATPFEHRPYGDELRRCQRYYEKSFYPGTAPVTAAGSSTGEAQFTVTYAGAVSMWFAATTFKVSKRSTPTITLYNPVSANSQVRNFVASTDSTGANTQNISVNGFIPYATGASGWAIGNIAGVHWTASAEL